MCLYIKGTVTIGRIKRALVFLFSNSEYVLTLCVAAHDEGLIELRLRSCRDIQPQTPDDSLKVDDYGRKRVPLPNTPVT
jgi:hypothetical protein